jgi:hypothetical protein
MAVMADDGTATLHGTTRTMGLPVFLAQPIPGMANGPTPFASAPETEWSWQKGWPFVGDWRDVPQAGFPVLQAPTLDVHGSLSLRLTGGNLSFTDVNGTLQVLDLDSQSEPLLPMTPAPEERVQAQALLLGAADATGIPVTGEYGLAGPRLHLASPGTWTWEHATGDVDQDGQARGFRDARVRAEGSLLAIPFQRPVTYHYVATGNLSSLQVDGIEQANPSLSPRAIAPAVGLTALVGAALAIFARGALGRGLAALYSRIHPRDLLQNQTRRDLLQIATAEPGVHMRAAQRRLGVGWGTLAFHVRMLESAGLIQVTDAGGYRTLSVPSGPPPAKRTHPSGKRLLEALPSDGGARDLSDLRKELGMTRQLLLYHARRLEAAGLVVIRPGHGSLSIAMRTTAS